jgi:hypothetical protein
MSGRSVADLQAIRYDPIPGDLTARELLILRELATVDLQREVSELHVVEDLFPEQVARHQICVAEMRNRIVVLDTRLARVA